MKNSVLEVKFSPNPDGGYRFRYEKDKCIVLDTKNGYTLYDDKMKYPSIFNNIFRVMVSTEKFDFTFDLKGRKNITGDLRYRWNNADIAGLLKFMCSPDDRRIILPSGIHDYMLEEKQYIYNRIKNKCTVEEYRRLTSDIFIFLCIEQGFSKTKANTMGNLVDFFQKNMCKDSWNI